MNFLSHSFFLCLRHLRALMRQPWYIAFTLVQPIIWLLLYGQLFKRVVELPGFHATSYITFLTPGVVVMTALFAGGWNGMAIIAEIDRGVMDRFLVSPVNRGALIAGRLLSLGVVSVVQSLILIVLGFILGARLEGGLLGILALLASAVLLSVPFGALSNAMALAVRKQESVIGASNFILLPLTFLSPVYMAEGLMPDWIRFVTKFNPVNWSVQAAREALSVHADWSLVLSRLVLLLLFALASGWIAAKSFRAYERSA
ncbi:MAG: ABC transporter permease [Bryobacteraceae bacterium]